MPYKCNLPFWFISDLLDDDKIIVTPPLIIEDAEGYPIMESIKDIDNHFGTKITNKIVVKVPKKIGEPTGSLSKSQLDL